MARMREIEVEGVKVLSLDFSRCTVAEAPGLMVEAAQLVRSQPAKSALTLSDFTDSRFDSEITRQLRVYSRDNKPFVKFGVVVGMKGMRMVIYRAVLAFTGRTDLELCPTVEAAKKRLLQIARGGP